MEGSIDFLNWVNPDLSSTILSYLNDPADIVRASAVSRSWRQFVIVNGLAKNLCLRLFPEISSATNFIEENTIIEPIESGSSDGVEVDNLKRNHHVYSLLARGLSPTIRKDCISEAIGASSTDNYPEERISNTLDPSDRVEEMGSYWSSEGESDPSVPERLTYRLSSKLCCVTEINIQPFQAFFQYGFPIYSAKAVRFRMGHFREAKTEIDLLDAEFGQEDNTTVDDYIEWTYISPEFPMAQENSLQKFQLPKPVVCIGGILQIELLGRVQSQEMDGLFYVCVAHVQVVGRPLCPPFEAELTDLSGKCFLKYCPPLDDEDEEESSARNFEDESGGGPSRLHSFANMLMQRAGMGIGRVIPFLGNVVVVDDETNESDDTDESDEELLL